MVNVQLIPGNQLSQLDPAIVTGEFAANRQGVLKRELMTLLTPVHVENSGPLLGSNRLVYAYFLLIIDDIHCNAGDLVIFRNPYMYRDPQKSGKLHLHFLNREMIQKRRFVLKRPNGSIPAPSPVGEDKALGLAQG